MNNTKTRSFTFLSLPRSIAMHPAALGGWDTQACPALDEKSVNFTLNRQQCQGTKVIPKKKIRSC